MVKLFNIVAGFNCFDDRLWNDAEFRDEDSLDVVTHRFKSDALRHCHSHGCGIVIPMVAAIAETS